MNFGELIKKYRNDNKMSMDDFAKKSGISKAYISMLEKNKNLKTGKKIKPSFDVIKKCAKACLLYTSPFSYIESLLN